MVFIDLMDCVVKIQPCLPVRQAELALMKKVVYSLIIIFIGIRDVLRSYSLIIIFKGIRDVLRSYSLILILKVFVMYFVVVSFFDQGKNEKTN